MRDPKLVRKYRVLDQDIAACDDKLSASRRADRALFIPSAVNRKMIQAEIDSLKARQKALEAPDEVFSLVKDHYADFLEGMQFSLDNSFQFPSRTLRSGSGAFTGLMRRDTRPDAERKKAFELKMAQYEQLFAAVFERVKDLEAGELNQLLTRMVNMRETVENESKSADEFMKQLGKDELASLRDKMRVFTEETLGKRAEALTAIITGKGGVARSKRREENETVPKNIEGYRKSLKAHGVDLDEIIAWHESEVEKTRSECFRLANALNIPERPVTTMKEVNDVLFKYAGPCDSAEEMFKRATEYVTRGTAAAREYVWLPEDAACMPTPMADYMKSSYPWGAGGSCDPNKRPFVGRFMLNNDNFRAITDGWIKINCTHEVHPGHYTQFLRAITDPMPETFKRGAKHTCLTEAMCVRTEKLLEYIFAEDPYYPLFTAYRRHHTSVRIMVDLWLNYFGKTIGDVMGLYQKELAFDWETARKQVQAHENDNGYFTTYYYGYKKISEWEKFYGFDKKEYTELLFSVGRVSLDSFERFLKLSEADRHSLTHDFASLNQFR